MIHKQINLSSTHTVINSHCHLSVLSLCVISAISNGDIKAHRMVKIKVIEVWKYFVIFFSKLDFFDGWIVRRESSRRVRHFIYIYIYI